MDKQIFSAAGELKEKINSGDEKYSALFNNCADAVKTVFEKGTGVDLPTGNSPLPNDKFETIKENATQVQDNIGIKTGEVKLITIPSTMDNIPAQKLIIRKPNEKK